MKQVKVRKVLGTEWVLSKQSGRPHLPVPRALGSPGAPRLGPFLARGQNFKNAEPCLGD